MPRKNKKQTRARLCRIQSLENRKMMAGDVSVAPSAADSRDLIISGDNASNQIVVQEIAVDRIRVTGLDGTLINGGTSPVTMTVRDDLTINMKGGNDNVLLRNLNQGDDYSHSDVTIDLGEGNDDLEILATDVNRHLNIKAGDGNDQIEVTETRAKDALIDGEYGDDKITVDELTTVASVTIESGKDDDTIVVMDSVINNDLLINADAGNDYVKVDNVDVFDDLRLNAGSGDDAVTVRDSQADDITVYGGVGDDDVNLWHNRVTDQLYASLGTGNDSLWFWGNRVGRHYFNGGTGTDTWYASYDYFWTWANFYNFE